MITINKILRNNIVLHICKYENIEFDEYIPYLNNEEKTKFQLFNTIKRKSEFVLVRYIIKTNIGNYTIIYNDLGAPELIDGPFISISHTKSYVVVATSYQRPVSVDIEGIQHRLEKLKHKFINTNEEKYIDGNNDRLLMLTSFWCAKETLYKISRMQNLSFLSNLICYPLSELEYNGIIQTKDRQENHKLYFIHIENYVLCYTINNNREI